MINLSPIKVDSREPDAYKLKNELSVVEVPALVTQLDHGDFEWTVKGEDFEQVVTVERKTVNDLTNSLHDGRLGSFVERTEQQSADIYILLIEQQPVGRGGGFRSVDFEAIDNLILECQMHGVYVVRYQKTRLAERLRTLWEWTGRGAHNGVTRPVLPTLGQKYLNLDEKRAVRFLMGIPGFGEAKCRNSVRALRSPWLVIQAIMSSDYSAFKNVPHVGKQSVDDAKQFMERIATHSTTPSSSSRSKSKTKRSSKT